MARIHPSPALLIRPEWAERVPSPLHDALDPVTRATVLATNPDSWLHVARRADDQVWLDPHDVAHRSAASLDRLMALGAYASAGRSSYFLYRYRDEEHAQIGLVADVPIEAFLDGSVLGHEHVEAPRVRALVAHQQHLSMRGDLIALLMPNEPGFNAIVDNIIASEPEVVIPGPLHHEVWRVPEAVASALTQLISPLRLYIVDGHHRVAAAVEEWQELGRPEGYSVLCLITPQAQLRALAFDRRLVGPIIERDPLAMIRDRCLVAVADGPQRRAGDVGFYWDGQWYAIHLAGGGEGVDSLDVIRLHRQILQPLFDIHAWGDPRLEVTSERMGVEVLQYRCDNDGGAAFIMKAPTVEEIVAVAERGEQMPFKSTYFDPKPWSGVFICPPDGRIPTGT